MQRGPAIPWATAEVIYQAYSALYGTSQSLERLHERGGFGWREVEVIFDELRRRKPQLYAALAQKDTNSTDFGR
jgi:hypothetical protein